MAATSWALGNIRTRTLGLRSGLPLVVWSALVVPLPLLLVSLVVEGPASWVDAWHAWGWRQSASTAYTVVLSTLFGYGVWNSLLARHPASRVVPFALLVPVVAMAGGEDSDDFSTDFKPSRSDVRALQPSSAAQSAEALYPGSGHRGTPWRDRSSARPGVVRCAV